MKDQDVKKATKIKIAETVIFPRVTYMMHGHTYIKFTVCPFDIASYLVTRYVFLVPLQWYSNPECKQTIHFPSFTLLGYMLAVICQRFRTNYQWE